MARTAKGTRGRSARRAERGGRSDRSDRGERGGRGERRRRRPLVDGATVLGIFCVAGLFGIWYVSKHGWEESVQRLFGSEEAAAEERPGWQPPTSVVHEGQAYEGPPWEQDPRWLRGMELGEQGIAELRAAYQRHAKEGDPFRLKHESDAARALLRDAVADLQALREDYAGSEAACHEIDKLLLRYGEGLQEGPKRF